MEEEIFKIINPTSNDSLSKMKGKDLQELFYYLEKYQLKLRDNINISNRVTFGLELEFEDANIYAIERKLEETPQIEDWNLKRDISLHNGGEITSPILRDDNKSWQELSTICEIIKENAIIGKNSGGHIHIGAQVLGDDINYWLNFIKLWSVYENIFYRFAFKEKKNPRTSLKMYAYPIAEKLKRDYLKLKSHKQLNLTELLDTISTERRQGLNFNNVSAYKTSEIKRKNTIEFRFPDESLDPITRQNNTNTFVKTLEYAKNPNFDEDTIDKRQMINNNEYQVLNLEWYIEIFLQQSLELCDMLFKNNLDKIYFLKQYLNDFDANMTNSSKKESILVKKKKR